jgi:hypothetical protein
MRRFWLVTGLLFACLLAVFEAMQALGIPLLTGPSPWMQGGGPLAVAPGPRRGPARVRSA